MSTSLYDFIPNTITYMYVYLSVQKKFYWTYIHWTYIHVHCNLFSFEFYIKTTNQINKTNQNLGLKCLNISKYMYSNIVKSNLLKKYFFVLQMS